MNEILIYTFFILGLEACATHEIQRVQNCGDSPSSFHCVEFRKNYDADTITVQISDVHPLFGHNISVRIRGIDTAEIKTTDRCEKDAAIAARDLVTKLLSSAKRIDLLNVSRDKYFRILADIEFDGHSLSKILVDSRLAVLYGGGTKPTTNWRKMGFPKKEY